MTIKEELHAEPKPGKKGYFDVAIPLADIRKESGRLQSLEGKAKEANILTEAEQQALQCAAWPSRSGGERQGRDARSRKQTVHIENVRLGTATARKGSS